MADNTTQGGSATIRAADRGGVLTGIGLIDVGGEAGPEAIVGDPGVHLPVEEASAATTLATLENIVTHTANLEELLANPGGSNSRGAMAMGWDGSVAQRLSIDSTGRLLIVTQPHASGGCDIFRSIDLDETEEQIKATAGTVYSIHAVNLASEVRYLKLYNATAANVTVGSTTPVLTLAIPAATNKAGFIWSPPNGLAFSTAISAAATTGVADSDTGSPGANDVVVNIAYR